VDYIVHEEWDDPATALTQAFALANRNVYEITGEGAAASTMVVALVEEPEGVATIANVGDSRAYIVVGGEARPITDDHSIVAVRVAAGQITALEARTAPDRNVLTRSIGSETEVLVDLFGPRQLALNERLVLCTDGVHGMIDDEALGRIGGGYPIADVAAALVAAAVEAGGKDNATALVGGYAPVATAAPVGPVGPVAPMAPPAGFGPGGAPPAGPGYGASYVAPGYGPGRRPDAARLAMAGRRRRFPKLAVLAVAGLVVALVGVATLGLVLLGGHSDPDGTSLVSASATSPLVPIGQPTATKTAAPAPAVARGVFADPIFMKAARTGATATLLPESNRVLIAGGNDGTKDLATAELYDPIANEFIDTGGMKIARRGATATLLENGLVLITGGSTDKTAELYDPEKRAFSKTGSMKAMRIGATATLLAGGDVLIAGGSNEQTAEVYNQKYGAFVLTGKMSATRTGATATLFKDGPLKGQVLVAGGGYNSADLYDPGATQFTRTGSLTVARKDATAQLLNTGSVLIAGGSDGQSAELYDPKTKSFVKTGSMTSPRSDATSALLPDGKVLVAGGDTDKADLYDPTSGTFAETTPVMSAPRTGATATLIPGKGVLIAGGTLASTPITPPEPTAEMYILTVFP
jgi:hypothetical protein